MKTIKHFLLTVAALLCSTSMLGVEVEIDGINYDIITKAKQAKVIAKSSGEYTGNVVIPESVEYEGVSYAVTSIGTHAFVYSFRLTSVTIPNSVTSIGEDAFFGCSDLTSVTIGNSVTSIGEYAFYECSGLTSVTIPNSVTSIGESAFYGCSGLTSVTIGNSVMSIGESAFYGCSGLTSVTIPNSVTSIGESAFYGCSGLTSVTIPNSVTSIAHHAFCYCSGLTSVTIPNSVTSIGHHAFYECSGLTSVTIPNSVTSIGEYAFQICSGLTSVTIGNSVTSIGNQAFYGCSGLTSVTIPNSVRSIGWYAFAGCSGLTSVTIGNSVTSIGSGAFSECSELTDVYCYAEQVPSTESGAFAYSYVEYATLHVPAASIEDYKATEPWNSFGGIIGLTNENYEENNSSNAYVDMTSIIANAGFDENLTFTTDGKYKEGTALNAENNSLSDRSWSYVHPDGSCYAHAKTAEEGNENWKQKDSRTWASNGFVAQINGWECRKTEYPKCEWVYSGALPYGLHPRAIPIADDGATYQDSPSKPAFAANNDNKGALFLRVGWSGSLSYKQTLNIPGGKYRFEYWTINVNTNSSKSYTDLSNITFNDVALTDMSGNDLSSTKWTRHYIDFQLSSASTECVIEIACKAAHTGSGNLPHVFIDGLKLYKLGNIELEGLKYKLNDNNKAATVIGGDDSPKVVIPESFFYAGNCYNVTEIGDSAFKNSCIVSVNIPNSITKIGDSAFFGCHKLADIYCNSETVPTTAINAFDYTDAENITLHVPEKSITDYMNTEPWSMFCSITDILKEIAIIDNGEAYYNSYHKETNIITYTRTFNNTEWQALYIPFAINYDDWTEDFEVAKINDIHQFDVNEDGDFDDAEDKTIMEMLKVNSGTLKANHPYMIRAKSIGEKTLTVENGTLMPTLENSIDCSSVERKYVFTGTYSGIKGEMMVSNKYYAMSGGNMKYSTNTANALKPFRWYMQIQDRDGQVIEEASEIKVVVRGDEDWDITGIEETNTDKGSFIVYSISGTLVRNVKATDINQATEGLTAGLYIVNGKKVLVK